MGLHLTEPQVVSIRPTEDVDTVVQVANMGELERLRVLLRKKGFQESPEEKNICRFRNGELILDVMPDDFNIYGFTNRWYKPGIDAKIEFPLKARTIKIFSALYLLATKMEAFLGRGQSDFFTSHDIEDIVNLFDGRPFLGNEVRESTSEAGEWIRGCLRDWVARPEFADAVEAHVTERENSFARREIVLERMRAASS
ncbi:MAG: hypothetical protein KF865_00195 [Bdellovibrionaceae bacterium]|nr:hypothetical protein [Pseudobdellovibrionaceae bacterium]